MNIRKHLNTLYEVTKANVKLHNESSYLGIVWYLLGPILLFSILLFVFMHRLGADIEQYPLYLLLGVIAWNFFSSSTGKAMNALVANAGIITALPIPFWLFITATVFHGLVIHSIELVVFFTVLIAFGIPISFIHVLLFCIVLLLSLFFTLGIAFALASLFPLLRDLHQIWSVVTRAWWFATPVFYAPTPTGWGRRLSLFNPMYYVLHLQRELLIYKRIPSLWEFAALALFALCSCIVGYTILHIMRRKCIELL